MEGYDFIFEHHKIADSDFVPNTIEDFHDTKKVRQSINVLPSRGATELTNRLVDFRGKLRTA